ncbi:unnamed protein product, partial [marine sediment metagenome]
LLDNILEYIEYTEWRNNVIQNTKSQNPSSD